MRRLRRLRSQMGRHMHFRCFAGQVIVVAVALISAGAGALLDFILGAFPGVSNGSGASCRHYSERQCAWWLNKLSFVFLKLLRLRCGQRKVLVREYC